MNFRLPIRKCLETLILIVFLLFPSALLAHQFKVIRVYDGDTIKVEGYGTQAVIRLVGIDAPEASDTKREPAQPFYQEAKRHLASLILNKSVEVEAHGLERHDTYWGTILFDGKNINLEMVRKGLAEVYRGKSPEGVDLKPFIETEEEARAVKRGMWKLGDKYISPHRWRMIRKARLGLLLLYCACEKKGK